VRSPEKFNAKINSPFPRRQSLPGVLGALSLSCNDTVRCLGLQTCQDKQYVSRERIHTTQSKDKLYILLQLHNLQMPTYQLIPHTPAITTIIHLPWGQWSSSFFVDYYNFFNGETRLPSVHILDEIKKCTRQWKDRATILRDNLQS
jgi:hypothetical protein